VSTKLVDECLVLAASPLTVCSYISDVVAGVLGSKDRRRVINASAAGLSFSGGSVKQPRLLHQKAIPSSGCPAVDVEHTVEISTQCGLRGEG
jgi:hypothetical protein